MERKLLQIVVALAGFAPVSFGLAGVLFGTTFSLVAQLILVPLLWQRHVASHTAIA